MTELLAAIPGWATLQDQVRAALADDDPTALLVAEHEWLRSITSATDAAFLSGARLDTDEFRKEQLAVRVFIEKHILKEELLYFPRVEAALASNAEHARTQEMRNEHDAIRIRYENLQKAFDHGTVRRTRAFRHLWRALVVHFDNEERYLLEEVRWNLSRQERHKLVHELADFKIPTGP